MKKIIRLTESDLHRIVKESVQRILNEDKHKYYYDPNDPEAYEEFDTENPRDWRTLAYLRKLRRISHEDPKSEYFEDPIEGHEAAFNKEQNNMEWDYYNYPSIGFRTGGGLFGNQPEWKKHQILRNRNEKMKELEKKDSKKSEMTKNLEDIKRARKIADAQGIKYKGRGYNLNPKKKKNKA